MQRFGFTLAVMLAVGACGGSDHTNGQGPAGNTGPATTTDAGRTPPQCGNGTCEAGETCGTCVDDCACMGATACRNDACVDWDTINPLIAKLPGRWVRIEPNDQREVDVTVNPNDHTCEYQGHPQGDPGDACIHGFSPVPFILSSDRLHVRAPDNTYHADGQVLEDGRRVGFDLWQNNLTEHITYVKQ